MQGSDQPHTTVPFVHVASGAVHVDGGPPRFVAPQVPPAQSAPEQHSAVFGGVSPTQLLGLVQVMATPPSSDIMGDVQQTSPGAHFTPLQERPFVVHRAGIGAHVPGTPGAAF